ncbi:hypothetical protein [Nonomuraea insulae]|uniref:Uncharacterized protein n=1 Tax=Nonomuraea insulae TaxID=1616787 RepID=A0ABW1D528_9ACTN
MNPLRRPRLWVRIAAIIALTVALWLLLIPRTALYYVDDAGHPYDISALYSWGTTEQSIIGALRLPRSTTSDHQFVLF